MLTSAVAAAVRRSAWLDESMTGKPGWGRGAEFGGLVPCCTCVVASLACCGRRNAAASLPSLTRTWPRAWQNFPCILASFSWKLHATWHMGLGRWRVPSFGHGGCTKVENLLLNSNSFAIRFDILIFLVKTLKISYPTVWQLSLAFIASWQILLFFLGIYARLE